MGKRFRLSSLFNNFSDDCAAGAFEFVGTTCFLLFGLGGMQVATAAAVGTDRQASTLDQVLYIATSMGLSLLISACLGPVRFVLYCIAQMLGAIAASAMVRGLTSAPLSANTVLQKGTSRAQGVFIEMFITTALVTSVLMLAAEKHQATSFAPAHIRFAAHYTGASMNTARAFGPAVVSGFPDPYHWVYWVGPFLGPILGAAFYALLKHYQYWRLTPDQATSGPEKSPDDPLLKVQKKTLTTSRACRGAEDAAIVGPSSGAKSGQMTDRVESDLNTGFGVQEGR
ncbi:aquaporin-like protein, partial [Gymnopilus junonius]